jgi:hypothetical protein
MKPGYRERRAAKHEAQNINFTPLLLANQTQPLVLSEEERQKLACMHHPNFDLVWAYHNAGIAVAAAKLGWPILEIDYDSGPTLRCSENYRRDHPKACAREDVLIWLCATVGAKLIIESLPDDPSLAYWHSHDVLTHVDTAKRLLLKAGHTNITWIINVLIEDAAARSGDPAFRQLVRVLAEELHRRPNLKGDEATRILTDAVASLDSSAQSACPDHNLALVPETADMTC